MVRARWVATCVALALCLCLVPAGSRPAAASTPHEPPVASARVLATGSASVLDVGVRSDGATVVTGTFQGQTTIDPAGAAVALASAADSVDGFIAAFDAAGALEWAYPLGGPGTDAVEALLVRPDDSVVVTGRFVTSLHLEGATTATDLTPVSSATGGFVASWSVQGELLDAVPFGTTGGASGLDLTVDGLGAVYLGGSATGSGLVFGALPPPAGARLFVVRLGEDLQPAWRVDVDGWRSTGVAIAGRPGGGVQFVHSVYGVQTVRTSASATEHAFGQSSMTQLVMTTVDGVGEPSSPLRLGEKSGQVDALPTDALVLPDGDVVLTARLSSAPWTMGAAGDLVSLERSGPVVARVSPPGEVRWITRMEQTSGAGILDQVVRVGSDLAVVGQYSASASASAWFAADPLRPQHVLDPTDGVDAVVARLDAEDGFATWVSDLGSTGPEASLVDRASGVAATPTGAIRAVGRFGGTGFAVGDPATAVTLANPTAGAGARSAGWMADLGPAGPAVPARGCTRAIGSGQNARGVVLTDDASAGIEQLDAWSEVKADPTLSPDGHRAAYLVRNVLQGPDSRNQYDLWVRDLDPTGPARILDTTQGSGLFTNGAISFSPSGNLIAYVGLGSGMRVLPFDGSLPARVVSGFRGFTADDRVLVADAGAIRVEDVDGSNPQTLPVTTSGPVALAPAGDLIVFRSASGSVQSIPTAGGAPVEIVPAGTYLDVAQLSVSPDGSHLALAASTADGWEVALVPLAGGPVQTVLDADPALPFTAPVLWYGPLGTLFYAAGYVVEYHHIWELIPSVVFVLEGHASAPGYVPVTDASGTTTLLLSSPTAPFLTQRGTDDYTVDERFVQDLTSVGSLDPAYTGYAIADATGGTLQRMSFGGHPLADLHVTVTASEGPVAEGDEVRATITVANDHARCTADPVAVDIGLPGLTDVVGTPSAGTFDGATWTVGPLPPGASAELAIDSASGPVPVGGDVIALTAAARTDGITDTDQTDDSAAVAIARVDEPRFHVLDDPVRIVDSRAATGIVPTGPLAAGVTSTIDVTGPAGVPHTGVGGVWLNVTAVQTTADTHLTIWPTGEPMPATSNLNLPAGDTRAAAAFVAPGADGTISVRTNSGTAHVVVDVAGWADAGLVGPEPQPGAAAALPPRTGISAVTPARLLDTRDGTGVPGGTAGPLGVTAPLLVDVTGVGGVPPSGVTAIVANLTAVGPTAGTHLTAWAAGAAQPGVSSLNLPAGAIRPNLVVIPVGSDGSIAIANNAGATHVLLDVVGWIGDQPDDGHPIESAAPVRLVDTREGSGPLGPDGTVVVSLDGVVAPGTSAVLVNVTGIAPSAPTHLSAWPTGVPAPGTSVLNLGIGQVAANLVLVPVGGDGTITIRNNAGQTHVAVDLLGSLGA